MNQKKNFVEIFAGAGGLGEGFVQAGFAPLAFVEMDKHACNTLRTRNAYHYLKKRGKLNIYRSYQKEGIDRDEMYNHVDPLVLGKVICAEINGSTIDGIFKEIHEKMKGSACLDVLLGGPPCQAYSVANRKKRKNDDRLFLYEYFGLFLSEFAPKMFVFENVPGLLSIDGGRIFTNIQDTFNNLGYMTVHKILNTKDFGILQSRQRLIMIGKKNVV